MERADLISEIEESRSRNDLWARDRMEFEDWLLEWNRGDLMTWMVNRPLYGYKAVSGAVGGEATKKAARKAAKATAEAARDRAERPAASDPIVVPEKTESGYYKLTVDIVDALKKLGLTWSQFSVKVKYDRQGRADARVFFKVGIAEGLDWIAAYLKDASFEIAEVSYDAKRAEKVVSVAA